MTAPRDHGGGVDGAVARFGGVRLAGGTPLFRLCEVDNAARWQDRLARHHIRTRIFAYSETLLRPGLPGPDGWDRPRAAL